MIRRFMLLSSLLMAGGIHTVSAADPVGSVIPMPGAAPIANGDTATAFSVGKNAANASLNSVFGQVSQSNGTGMGPLLYNTNAPQQSLFGGAGLISSAVSKISTCGATNPGYSGNLASQECDAVNFLAKNPTQRVQFNISKSDPMFARAKGVIANASSTFNSTQCSTRTETTPAQYATETCSLLKGIDEQQCTMGRVVNIDADSNFQCDRTVKSLTSTTRTTNVGIQSCTMGRVVNIDGDSNFQCDQTVNAYETLKCNRSYNASVTNSCTSQWVSRTFNPPTGPTGHVLSTYDDLRYGAGFVCAVLWPGSSPVSASCYPAPLDRNLIGPISTHGGCDHLHNGGWFYSVSCRDQQWCNGDGIASITCQKLETVCNPVVTITQVDGCATLEARAQ